MIHLVTGAAGFLGRYLVRALLSRGETVRAFDLSVPHDAEVGVEWRVGDVRDAEAVRKACEGVEVAYHLAALIPQRRADATTMQAVNVGGTQHMLDGALEMGVRRVVYLSSVEIFGVPAIVPCPEDGPLAPLGEYGRNKIVAEKACCQAVERGLEVTILRPPTIVGPGLGEPFLVGLLNDVRAGRPVTLLGNGQNRFQFVHAEDVVAACLLVAEHPAAVGQAFHIGSADVPPIRSMVEEVIAQVGSASKVRSIPVPVARLAIGLLRPFGKAPLEPEHLAIAISDYVFDIQKARRVLGWEPRWGNVDAIVDTYRADFA
ncbi:MAG: NAD-dependent epimerase/dehydratase family protein [Anaerolineae bacterium]